MAAVELRPGPASMAGLDWLARVGPAPIEAWRCAMGWGERVARSHAGRLEREGWVARQPMLRGGGSLLVVTRRGVRMTGRHVTAPAVPEPTWWAHDCACAWTAAWLTAHHADWRGPREVLTDPSMKRKLEWQTRVGYRRAGHRPDLAVQIANGRVAVEVELERKSTQRMHAILVMYRRWIGEGKLAGIVYVCGSERIAERVEKLIHTCGVPSAKRRVELLDSIREQVGLGPEQPARLGHARGAGGLTRAVDRGGQLPRRH